MIMKRRQKAISRAVFPLLAIILALGAAGVKAEDEIIREEILIKVQPRIIALSSNLEIARVPLSAARVRSTPLRKLNKKYNAISLERLYQIKQGPVVSKASDSNAFTSTEKVQVVNEKVDLSTVFTKDGRDKLLKKRRIKAEEIVPAEGIFLVQFEFNQDDKIIINQLVKEYQQLAVVLDAQYITRGK